MIQLLKSWLLYKIGKLLYKIKPKFRNFLQVKVILLLTFFSVCFEIIILLLILLKEVVFLTYKLVIVWLNTYRIVYLMFDLLFLSRYFYSFETRSTLISEIIDKNLNSSYLRNYTLTRYPTSHTFVTTIFIILTPLLPDQSYDQEYYICICLYHFVTLNLISMRLRYLRYIYIYVCL